ncbi:hypothetical protein D3C80_2113370 [compost metagenome]
MLPGTFFAFTLQAYEHTYTQGSSEMGNVQGFKHDCCIDARGRAVVEAAWDGLKYIPAY